MLALTFWKVSPKGKAFTLIGVPPMAVMAVVIITGGAVAVVMAVGVAAAVVITPRKGSGGKPQEILPTEKGGIPLGALNTKGSTSGGNRRTP